jgi:hypothetical protein
LFEIHESAIGVTVVTAERFRAAEGMYGLEKRFPFRVVRGRGTLKVSLDGRPRIGMSEDWVGVTSGG